MSTGPSQANLGHLLEPLEKKCSAGGTILGKEPVSLWPCLPQHGTAAFLETDANAKKRLLHNPNYTNGFNFSDLQRRFSKSPKVSHSQV